MYSKIIEVKDDTIIGVIGDIHEHKEQFHQIIKKFEPNENRILVSLGDIYDKGSGIKTAEEITDVLIDLNAKGYSYTVPGNHEFKHIKKSKNKPSKQLAWIKDQPTSITFVWPNNTKLLVLHAGVTPKMKEEDLCKPDVLYVRTVDGNGNYVPIQVKTINGETTYEPVRPGVNWHEIYDGRFGYICAGHDAQRDGCPKYFQYSCNIDTACYFNGILSCQLFDSNGLGELIKIQGSAVKHYKQ